MRIQFWKRVVPSFAANQQTSERTNITNAQSERVVPGAEEFASGQIG